METCSGSRSPQRWPLRAPGCGNPAAFRQESCGDPGRFVLRSTLLPSESALLALLVRGIVVETCSESRSPQRSSPRKVYSSQVSTRVLLPESVDQTGLHKSLLAGNCSPAGSPQCFSRRKVFSSQVSTTVPLSETEATTDCSLVSALHCCLFLQARSKSLPGPDELPTKCIARNRNFYNSASRAVEVLMHILLHVHIYIYIFMLKAVLTRILTW